MQKKKEAKRKKWKCNKKKKIHEECGPTIAWFVFNFVIFYDRAFGESR